LSVAHNRQKMLAAHMAKLLNKNRIRDTKISLLLCAVIILFTEQVISLRRETPLHEAFDYTGYILITLCAIGRVYCTAFLGGHKNQTLIAYGPFSMCRNPLYFCSFLGACGIALMSNHILLFFIIPFLFLAVFINVIRREESYLRQEFGESYTVYCATTPRLIPNPFRYHAPETITTYPKFLLKGVQDGLMWFLAFPFIEAVEYLHEAHILKPLIVIP